MFLIIIGYYKVKDFVEVVPYPQPVFLYQWKDFFVGNSVYTANNQELLLEPNQLIYVLSEQGKRWVGYYYVCFFEKRYTFLATKISIIQHFRNEIFEGDPVLIPHILQLIGRLLLE